MKKTIRVLHVFGSLDRGGAETFIMNIYRNLNLKSIQFDFVVNESNKEYSYENEILQLGGRIFRVPKYNIINKKKYEKSWEKLLDEHPEWKIIHGHHSTPAKKYMSICQKKQRKVIIHSHTAGSDGTIKGLVKKYMRRSLKRNSDYLMACSQKASDWMFGKDNTKTMIVKNGIDIKEFSFDIKKRDRVREKLKLENETLVVGHVGRFDKAKNQSFLIDIFNELQSEVPNSKLLLIGDGENKRIIEEKVNKLNLEEKVIFTGLQNNVKDYLNAMDIFVFPSLFEGLPVSVIEAQANGLNCIISDSISNEVSITKLVERLSLSEDANYWSKRIVYNMVTSNRKEYLKDIYKSGYNVLEVTRELEAFYLKV